MIIDNTTKGITPSPIRNILNQIDSSIALKVVIDTTQSVHILRGRFARVLIILEVQICIPKGYLLNYQFS